MVVARSWGREMSRGLLKGTYFELWGWRRLPEKLLDSTEIKPFNLKGNQPWILIRWTDAQAEDSVFWSSNATANFWKSLLSWEKLRAEGEEDIRGWDGWMASPMQWTETWSNFGRWWGTERPSMLQSMGSQESVTTRWLNNNKFTK